MSMMLGISVSNRKRMEIKDMSGKVVGSVTVTKGKASQVVVKKRLPYSFKEISTRLLKTKKSGNAHQVLISARQKAVSLRLMYKGGVYDDDEVLAALMHAQAIVRVAKSARSTCRRRSGQRRRSERTAFSARRISRRRQRKPPPGRPIRKSGSRRRQRWICSGCRNSWNSTSG